MGFSPDTPRTSGPAYANIEAVFAKVHCNMAAFQPHAAPKQEGVQHG